MTFIGNATLDPLTLQIWKEEGDRYTADLIGEHGKRTERHEHLTRQQIQDMFEDFDFSEVRW